MKNKKKRKSRGYLSMAIGVVFLLAAAGLIIYNVREAQNAYEASLEVLPEIEDHIKEKEEENLPSTATKNKELPTLKVQGDEYVGQLDIPAIDLTLPVMAEWSYANLKKAPCAYSGSPYIGNFVIAGHNYARHFSPIKNLPEGTEVYFTDMDADTFIYKVTAVEILNPNQVEDMTDGEGWDMTLFTCTTGGQRRHALRCTLADEE